MEISRLFAFVGDENVNVVSGKKISSVKPFELGKSKYLDYVAAQSFYKISSSLERAACGDKIVQQDHFLPGKDGFLVDLDRGRAVFKRIFLGDRFFGELALFADQHHGFVERICYRRTEDEAS